MAPSILLITVFLYITLLFCLAQWGDRQHFANKSWIRQPLVYALALGVYCTSWTFYGLVGTASVSGWKFLPILLGPILLFTIGYPLLERIRRLSRQEHIHSIADFIASRYGRRQGVAATVSLVVLLATIPYIALQLKAVSDTLLLTIGTDFLVHKDLTFVITLAMIAFALVFGARRLDVSGYHSGLMSVIAFESVVKLAVLMVLALFAISWIGGGVDMGNLRTANSGFFQPPSWLSFGVETLLSACAIFCLPRMFHVTFVECLSANHLRKSRWVFVGYLLLITLCVLVISAVGNLLFFGDSSVKGDAYVISLPLQQDMPWLALIAFLGGFSAATAMIIVATITLSQMLSNDVILPLLVRRRDVQMSISDYSRSLIVIRRLTVILVVMAAYLYHIILAENAALTSIGLTAFALVVQLAPAILFGLYWRKGNASGLYAGLIIGASLWFYTLMIPLLVKAGLVGPAILEEGLFDIAWLRPEHLFGLSFSDSFTRGVIISLSANVLFYWWYSISTAEKLADRIQAIAFTRMEKVNDDPYEDINLDDLYALVKEFIGDPATQSLFARHKDLSKTDLVGEVQKILASTVGVASSQAMIERLRSGEKMAVEEVVNLFGETTKALRFNREVLSASFENISSGITVVDEELRLIAWNNRYEAIFEYPPNLLKVGLHIEEIMQLNSERGLLTIGNREELIRKRMSLMSSGKKYRIVRHYSDNLIIEIKGRPLPNGGYVTTYDDITEFILAQRELEDVNSNLEKRVHERTQTIEKINRDLMQEIERRSEVEAELRKAKISADNANASKTRLLALAGHDIMQPLNAASLYASALDEQDAEQAHLVAPLRNAIKNTESIISSLLEVSKLDSGVLEPNVDTFSLGDMLSNLVDEANMQCPNSLEIRYSYTSVNVRSDEHYLRRIIQNFISNAVKYTQQGKVLVGCRHRYCSTPKAVEIFVIDNGPGISEKELDAVFDDFYRSTDQEQQDKIPGLGLGLSVVMRFSELLHHPIKCTSALGKGSAFSVTVPIDDVEAITEQQQVTAAQEDLLRGLKVVHIDDDAQNLLAMSALLHRWQCDITSLNSIEQARKYKDADVIPDVLLMDYQLGDLSLTGVTLADEFIQCWQQRLQTELNIPVCIVSAATDPALPDIVANHGYELLRKPVKPAKLRALLTQFSQRKLYNRSAANYQ